MDDVEVGELLDSDDFKTLNCAHESDLDDKTWVEFNIESNEKNPKLEVGLLFPNKDSLKEAARQYGRVNNHNVKFPKENDHKRLKVVYKSHCSWYIWASRMNPLDPSDHTWQIRSLHPNHALRSLKIGI
ncbi:hypothetical protein PVK06_007553 [Gossypium arboreum]|uniref:Transposase MuDR plant domain-containing protein n=1 Tax=Gossypium arboreum TaxID=29729 RepID=A0ABR0QHV8_GOSAR|nr:hypothetical protein PVK06_007553 [Gossypium arboreum]